MDLSIILPAKNEAANLRVLLPRIHALYPEAQILVVDDGSTDGTADAVRQANGEVVRHPYSMGNGAAVKTGARAARGNTLVFMDADGQHNPDDISVLLTALKDGHDMVVGMRDSASQASAGRDLANRIYNRAASYITGHRVRDLTSGFRAVRAHHFREFIHLLPNGFSYPTTITMAFFRAGYAVGYVPIRVKRRNGNSHIRPLQDGLRFLLIIFRVGTLYSPLKVFVPASALLFATGLGYYLFTFITEGRLTNMSAILFMTSILTFLIGLVSEQITTLIYQRGPD